ncbi:MAG TPA: FAD-dependent oxidoreductase, partial [Brevibacterium sp.]|nr:FAD-dependent oxidoreductase [Brevibacterium sp.]
MDLPTDLREALARIAYGSYVSAAFLTGETAPQSWDRAYGIATPKRSFSVVLNMGNVVHGGQPPRTPGGSIMVFSPASLARALLDRTDEEVLRTYLEDLGDVLPGSPGLVEDAHVQRWWLGAPYCFPGRGRLQPTLTTPTDRVFLAGDYLATLYTESAISSASPLPGAQHPRSPPHARQERPHHDRPHQPVNHRPVDPRPAVHGIRLHCGERARPRDSG